MFRSNMIHRMMILLGTLVFLAGMAAVQATAPPPLDGSRDVKSCDYPNDGGIIGQVSANLGEAVGIPVYIWSDYCVEHFHFEFLLPVGINYDSVSAETWPYGFDDDMPSWDPQTRVLTVEQKDIHEEGCLEPNVNDVFLRIWVNTGCKSFHDATLPVAWGSVAHIDHGCVGDPLDETTDGSVHINRIDIGFGISRETAMVADQTTVTVICNNDFEFNSFNHAITYNPEELELKDVIYLDRTAIGVIDDRSTPGLIGFSVPNPDPQQGFGTAADGLDFYRLVFKVINDTDDDILPVEFADLPREVYTDCEKPLHDFANISYNNGRVTVPAYLVEFDIGNGVCINDNTDEFSVPLYMKNNFPVTEFSLSLKYNDNPDDTEFLRFDNTLGLTYVKKTCTVYKSAGYEYAVLMTEMITELAPRDDFECIGYLIFENTAPGSPRRDSLEFKDFGCRHDPEDSTFWDDETWVRTWNDIWGPRNYTYDDPQTNFIDGWISFEHPLVSIEVPNAYAARHWHKVGGYGWYTYDNWATTPITVYSNVDLDTLTFTIPWYPDEFYVSSLDVQSNAQVTINEDLLEATVIITDIEASPYRASYGKLMFCNGNSGDQSGYHIVTGIVAVETDPNGPLETTGSGGDIHLYGASPDGIACYIPDHWDYKQAAVPLQFKLGQNYPNPFNASTLIEFTLPEAAHTTLEVYNVLGRRVTTLMDDFTEAGPYSIAWNGRDNRGNTVGSGIYFYRLRSGHHIDFKKMVLMK